jgi:lactoylglutathione lyase
MNEANLVFDHVHLISKDAKSAAEWYVKKLGGKVINISEFRGAPQVVVAFKEMSIIIRGQRNGEQINAKNGVSWGTDHFGFRVDGDFDGFCGDLKKNGVTFTVEPMDFSPTVRIAFIAAPDGVSIELLQRKGS